MRYIYNLFLRHVRAIYLELCLLPKFVAGRRSCFQEKKNQFESDMYILFLKCDYVCFSIIVARSSAGLNDCDLCSNYCQYFFTSILKQEAINVGLYLHTQKQSEARHASP